MLAAAAAVERSEVVSGAGNIIETAALAWVAGALGLSGAALSALTYAESL